MIEQRLVRQVRVLAAVVPTDELVRSLFTSLGVKWAGLFFAKS